MKRRIARKIESRMFDRTDPRPWWERYRLSTLKAAERALRRAWRTHHVREFNPATGAVLLRSVTPEWYAANRMRSFVVRQPLVRASRRTS